MHPKRPELVAIINEVSHTITYFARYKGVHAGKFYNKTIKLWSYIFNLMAFRSTDISTTIGRNDDRRIKGQKC